MLGWGVTSGRSWTNSPADAWTRTPSSSSHQVDPRSSYPNQWTAEPMRSNAPTQRTQGWTSSPQEWKLKESLTEWVAQPWGLCSVTCGQGVKERRVHCMDKRGGLLPDSRCENLGRPESESFCNMGACPINQWLVGSWDVCTAQCGEGKEYRDVYCSGACSQTDRPQASRPCNATKPCSGHWVTDSGGAEMRQLCNMKRKPRERRQCNIQSCKPNWVTSQWSKCSASCGVGVETRHVVCLDGGERSSLCQNKEKPANSRECQANCTAPLLEIDQEQAEDIYNEDSDALNDDDNQEYNYDEYEEILDEPEQRDVGDNNEDSKDITDIISNKLDSLITSTRLMTNEVLHTADSLIPGNSLLDEDQDPAADGSKIQASPQVCLDNFKNCAIVVESELCKYNFYQINCCQSCTLNLK